MAMTKEKYTDRTGIMFTPKEEWEPQTWSSYGKKGKSHMEPVQRRIMEKDRRERKAKAYST